VAPVAWLSTSIHCPGAVRLSVMTRRWTGTSTSINDSMAASSRARACRCSDASQTATRMAPAVLWAPMPQPRANPVNCAGAVVMSAATTIRTTSSRSSGRWVVSTTRRLAGT
jgi:hypothetical protein